VQEEIAHALLKLVPTHVTPARVLDAGCGTGRLLALARTRWPGADCVGLDLSPGMLRIAGARFADDPRVALVEGDVARYQSATSFDLILSSSTLQWLRPLDAGLAHLYTQLRPAGWLAAALMTADTLHELRAARHAVAPHKDASGRLPTLAMVEQAATALPGVRIHTLDERRWIMPYPTARALFLALHAMGVTGGDVSQGPGPLTRGELTALEAHYEANYRAPGGGVQATYSAAFMLLEAA
jgi:malonyl-CoA O-methyltransferase